MLAKIIYSLQCSCTFKSNKNHIIELSKTLKQDGEPIACSNVMKIHKNLESLIKPLEDT